MKKLHLIALAALFILGFSGCEKEKVTNQAWADVFVKAIKNAEGATVYTAVHTVFSFNGMKSVSVTSPGGTVLELTNFEKGGLSFFNEPANADYLTTPPPVGSYTYTVKFNDGEDIVYTNTLTDAKLPPANITSVVKTTSGDSVYIYWGAIANVDAYGLKVQRGTTQIFKYEGFSDKSDPKKSVLRWGFRTSDLTSGISGIYNFEVTGFLIESSTTDYTYLQSKSASTKDITL